MQLSDIRTRVRYYLRESTANVWADAELNAHINLASKYVAQRLDEKYLSNLVTVSDLAFTTFSQNLPSDFMRPYGDPKDSAGVVYPLKPLKEAMALMAHTEDANSLFTANLFSYIQGGKLWKSFSEAETLNFPYLSFPATLSADGDISEINDGIIDLVIIKATADALIKTRQLQDSNALLSQVEQRIQMLNGGK